MIRWKCSACGYVHTGEKPPQTCPLCGVDGSLFIRLEENNDESEKPPVEEKDEQQPAKTEATASGKRWRCVVCNYIHHGDEPPDKCPVCGADSSMFVEIEEEAEVEPEQTAPVETPDQPQEPFGFIGRLVIGLNLHPISVHSPNGVLPAAVVFLLLGVLLNITSLEVASWYNLIFVLLTMPLVVFTGVVAWQRKYRGAKTPLFITKMICSSIIGVLLGVVVFWRFIDRDVAMSGTTGAVIYLAFAGIILVAAGIAGHLGGKLVFSKK